MPTIHVELWEGRPLAARKQLIEELTETTTRVLGCSKASVQVILNEVKKENWGMGGELCSEKFPD